MPVGWRLLMAILRALVTNVAVWVASVDQSTTLREKVPSTTAQYTLPSRVGCSVMSVTHNWFGDERVKPQLTRSLAVGGLVLWPRAPATRQPADAGAAHQHLHRVIAHDESTAQP